MFQLRVISEKAEAGLPQERSALTLGGEVGAQEKSQECLN